MVEVAAYAFTCSLTLDARERSCFIVEPRELSGITTNPGLVVCARWTRCFNLCKHKLTSIQQESKLTSQTHLYAAMPFCLYAILPLCLYAFVPLKTNAAIFGFH